MVAGANSNIPTCLAYQANNIRGQWKRAFCSATLVGFGGIGGIAGSLIFRPQDAPRYRPGMYAAITYVNFARKRPAYTSADGILQVSAPHHSHCLHHVDIFLFLQQECASREEGYREASWVHLHTLRCHVCFYVVILQVSDIRLDMMFLSGCHPDSPRCPYSWSLVS